MSQSITKNAFYNILLNIASVVFPLITAPYVSRVLEPDGVGLFNFANTYAGYFAFVAVLGIPTYGVREVSKSRDDNVTLSNLISQLISIAVITTFIISIIYLITIALIGQLNENYIIFLLAGFVIYLAPFKINWYYQGIEDFGSITKVSLVVKTLSVICLFLFVRDKGDLVLYVILSVLGGVMADLWNYSRMCRKGIKPHLTFTGLKQHMNTLFILFASTIAISIYTILDTLMLGFMTNYEEVGYYANAMHISRVIISAVTSLSLVAVPRVSYYMKSKDYEKINQLMNKSFSIVSFLAFPVAIGMLCISPTFVPLFFGEKFVGSVIPLMILSTLIIAVGLNNLTGIQILIGMGLDKLYLNSVLVGTVSNVLLNCVLIPVFGAMGASISSVIAEILILVVTVVLVYKNTPIRFEKRNDMFKSFVGAVLFMPVLFLLKIFLDGWLLVGLFIVCSSLVYIVTERILQNSSFYFIKAIVFNNIDNMKNRLIHKKK